MHIGGDRDTPQKGCRHGEQLFLHVNIRLIYSEGTRISSACISAVKTDTFQPPCGSCLITWGRTSFSLTLPSALTPAPPALPRFMPPFNLYDGRQSSRYCQGEAVLRASSNCPNLLLVSPSRTSKQDGGRCQSPLWKGRLQWGQGEPVCSRP